MERRRKKKEVNEFYSKYVMCCNEIDILLFELEKIVVHEECVGR